MDTPLKQGKFSHSTENSSEESEEEEQKTKKVRRKIKKTMALGSFSEYNLKNGEPIESFKIGKE